MRILITGAGGQLGQHLVKVLDPNHQLILTDRSECDLTDLVATVAMLDECRPEVIINTAAMTAVDAAEDDPTLADQLNHQLPACLAQWAASAGVPLMHYSTDYVFGGQQTRPWVEDDPKRPESVYGRSKHLGEEAVQAAGVGGVIIRTAWVYSALPGNFLTAILNKAKRGESLQVVDDQVGSPTWAGSLAKATACLLEGDHLPSDSVRTLHVANRGAMSWYAFACLAIEKAHALGLIDQPVLVKPVSSAQWPQKAKRPSGSVLDVSQYETLTHKRLASTQEALVQCLNEWRNA